MSGQLPRHAAIVVPITDGPRADGMLRERSALASVITNVSAGRWEVETIGFEAHYPSGQNPMWELPRRLDNFEVVEVCRPFSRVGEIAVLVARALHKPVCASDLSEVESEIGRSLGILDLADVVLCGSAAEVGTTETTAQKRTAAPATDTDLYVPSPAKRSGLVCVDPAPSMAAARRFAEQMSARTTVTFAVYHSDGPGLESAGNRATKRKIRFVDVREDNDLKMFQEVSCLVSGFDRTFSLGVSSPRKASARLGAQRAMACGVPIIATSDSGLADLVTGNSGMLVDDLQNLAEAAAQLQGGSSRLEKMSMAARQRAVETFSYDSVARARAELYDSMLAASIR